MKWVNHRIVTTTLVYVATGSVVYAAYSYLGSVLPDQLEGKPPKEQKAYWRWRKRHRRLTHWTIPYIAVILALWYLGQERYLRGIAWELALIPLFIAVGAVLHILEDGICGKIPLLFPNHRLGIRLFRVGSAWEYFFVYTLCVVALGWHFKLWHLLLNH